MFSRVASMTFSALTSGKEDISEWTRSSLRAHLSELKTTERQ